MEIAQKDDGETLQLGGPAAKCNVQSHDARAIRLDKKRITGDGRDSGGRGETDKLSPVSRKKCQSIFGLYFAFWTLRDSGACRTPAYREPKLRDMPEMR